MGFDPASTLAWTSTEGGDGISTRGLDVLETFFADIFDSGAAIHREHFMVSAAFRLGLPASVEDPAALVRRAWLAVRRLHPSIGSYISKSESRSGFGPEESQGKPDRVLAVGPVDPDAWLNETFVQQGDAKDAASLFPKLRPRALAACHWLPRSGEVCFQCSHWRIDGRGMFLLAHDFIMLLALALRHGPDSDIESLSGLEVGRLTPSLEHVVGAYLDEESTPTKAREALDALVGEMIRGAPSIGTPTKPGSETALPGETHRLVVPLDGTATQQVVDACKRRGVSVTSAVHAAIVRAVTTYPQHPLVRSYSSSFPTDMRPYLPLPWTETSCVIGNYCSGLPFCVDDVLLPEGGGRKSFDDIVAKLSTEYARDMDRVCPGDDNSGEAERARKEGREWDSDSFVPMAKLRVPFVNRLSSLMKAPVPEDMPPAQEPQLSSFGVVDKWVRKIYGDPNMGAGTVEVREFWIAVHVASRSLQLHVWTFQGKLHIQTCFNRSYYEPYFAREVLAKVKNELLEGLQVLPSA